MFPFVSAVLTTAVAAVAAAASGLSGCFCPMAKMWCGFGSGVQDGPM